MSYDNRNKNRKKSILCHDGRDNVIESNIGHLIDKSLKNTAQIKFILQIHIHFWPIKWKPEYFEKHSLYTKNKNKNHVDNEFNE